MSNLNNNYTVQKQIQYQIVKVDINKKKYLELIDVYSKCGFCPEAVKSQRAQTFKGVTFDTMQLGHFLSTFSRTKPYLFTSLTRTIKYFHKISEKKTSHVCVCVFCVRKPFLSLSLSSLAMIVSTFSSYHTNVHGENLLTSKQLAQTNILCSSDGA
jgi:kynurenine formamidase